MPFTATFIVLSFAGLINASYLTYKHYFEKEPLVCPIEGHDCNAVVQSRWSHMFSVRNEVLGVVFYGAALASGLLLALNQGAIPGLRFYILIGTGLGMLFSVFLTYLQKFVIHEFCFYCLISAGLSLLIFINGVALYN